MSQKHKINIRLMLVIALGVALEVEISDACSAYLYAVTVQAGRRIMYK